MDINARLKEVRIALGYSQRQMGELLRISQASYSLYENDKQDFPESYMDLLYYKAGVSIEWLKTGNGHMFNSIPYNDIDKSNKENESRSPNSTVNLEEVSSDFSQLRESEQRLILDLVKVLADIKKT